MHIVGIMFFLTVLALAVGTILTVVFEYKDRIIGVLLGGHLSSHDDTVVVNYRSNTTRLRRETSASNEDFTLPLAA